MDCKKIQEFIITDYVDARMNDEQKSLIDRHLAHCHACEDFLISIKKDVVAPFKYAHQWVPEASLWDQIKQAIEEDEECEVEKSFIPDFWARLRSSVHIPRPAFALVTIVTMIFMIGSTGQFFINSQVVKINGQDQMEYLSSLIDQPMDLASSNSNDTQTPIEKYFL